MARLLIDVESTAGVKYGSGPITSATGWRQVKNLDRLGQFTFSMPASDPKAALLVNRRVVRARHDNVELGAGVIDQIDVQAGNPSMLTVSGLDLGVELTRRVTSNPLYLADRDDILVIRAYTLPIDTGSGEATGSPTDQPNMHDGDLGTYGTYAVGSGGSHNWLYIGHVEAFDYVSFVISNGTPWVGGAGTWQYFDGEAWVSLAPTSDTTYASGCTLMQSGTVAWASKSDMCSTVQNGRTAYWIRVHGTEASTRRIYDIRAEGYEPTADALQIIAAELPSGWGLSNYVRSPGLAAFDAGESETDGYWRWDPTRVTWSKVDEPARSVHERYSLKVEFTNHADTYCGVLGTLAGTFAPGDPVTAGAWLTGSGDVEFYLAYEDADGADFDYEDHGTITLSTTPTRYTVSGTCPASTARVSMGWNRTSGTPTLYINSPQISKSAAAIAYMGYGSTAKSDVYGSLHGENFIEALGKLADLTGEHWRVGPSRTIAWLRDEQPDCGIRAVSGGDPIAVESNDDICLIRSLKETEDSYDCVTRVYPRGAGFGDGQLTLLHASKSAPAGYTYSTSGNYVEHTAGYAADPAQRTVVFADIGPETTDQRAREYAADQLLDAAVVYLARRVDSAMSYDLEVVKVAEALLPGTSIRVVYRHSVDGFVAINIDEELIILSASVDIDSSGIQTTALTVSTIAAWPISDAELMARLVSEGRARSLYPQPIEAYTQVNTTDFTTRSGSLAVGGGGLSQIVS